MLSCSISPGTTSYVFTYARMSQDSSTTDSVDYIGPHEIGTVSDTNPPALRAAPFTKGGIFRVFSTIAWSYPDLAFHDGAFSLKLRRPRTILACRRSIWVVTHAVRAGEYRPEPDTATPSLATLLRPGIYGICSRVSCSISMQ